MIQYFSEFKSNLRTSPVGIRVENKTITASVKGRTITFEVSACDKGGEPDKGTHIRMSVDGEKLFTEVQERIAKEKNNHA